MPPAYQLIIQPSAERDLRSLPKTDIKRIARRIQFLVGNPRPAGCRKLSDTTFRVRQGDYRILYDVDDKARTVTFLKIGHRREVYRS
ncbi:MAG: type II toxin-antitoxin system RelE/ParE family toxin [Terriglobia bacterium]